MTESRYREWIDTPSSMNTRESYRDGLSLGAEYADADRANRMSFASGEAELREDAQSFNSPSWRAFKLGIVRGYRDAVRTLRAGKWGT